MINFTREELALLKIIDIHKKCELLKELREGLNNAEDNDMKNMLEVLIDKIEFLTEDEVESMDFESEFDE